MKLHPLHKVDFGYIIVTDGPLFRDCRIDYDDFLSILLKTGKISEEDLSEYNIVQPSEKCTHINLPTPRGKEASKSQKARISYLEENQGQFEEAVKSFLVGLRSESEPIFPPCHPIEMCICNPHIVIPYDADKHGIKVYFQCDWGVEMIGITFFDESNIEEWDIDIEKFF